MLLPLPETPSGEEDVGDEVQGCSVKWQQVFKGGKGLEETADKLIFKFQLFFLTS